MRSMSICAHRLPQPHKCMHTHSPNAGCSECGAGVYTAQMRAAPNAEQGYTQVYAQAKCGLLQMWSRVIHSPNSGCSKCGAGVYTGICTAQVRATPNAEQGYTQVYAAQTRAAPKAKHGNTHVYTQPKHGQIQMRSIGIHMYIHSPNPGGSKCGAWEYTCIYTARMRAAPNAEHVYTNVYAWPKRPLQMRSKVHNE